MQIDRNALNRILGMNDEQLSALITQIAKETGIDPTALGLNPQNIAGVRSALSGATESDIQKLDALYADYRRNRRQR
ncbi:MAG: hypothetical protein SOZ51_08555 [Eubacteriales bacterium]|nr:hypothetical protein [Eubacteriales bacterium]